MQKEKAIDKIRNVAKTYGRKKLASVINTICDIKKTVQELQTKSPIEETAKCETLRDLDTVVLNVAVLATSNGYESPVKLADIKSIIES